MCIKIIDWQRRVRQLARRHFLDRIIDRFNGKVAGGWNASLREFFGRAGIDEYGCPIDFENLNYSFQFDFGWPAERTPNRDTKLISTHVGKPGRDQLFG
jgi:hypothetical protein